MIVQALKSILEIINLLVLISSILLLINMKLLYIFKNNTNLTIKHKKNQIQLVFLFHYFYHLNNKTYQGETLINKRNGGVSGATAELIYINILLEIKMKFMKFT